MLKLYYLWIGANNWATLKKNNFFLTEVEKKMLYALCTAERDWDLGLENGGIPDLLFHESSEKGTGFPKKYGKSL